MKLGDITQLVREAKPLTKEEVLKLATFLLKPTLTDDEALALAELIACYEEKFELTEEQWLKLVFDHCDVLDGITLDAECCKTTLRALAKAGKIHIKVEENGKDGKINQEVNKV